MKKRSKTSDPLQKHYLTSLQERFVNEYLIDLNQTAAALRAGYKSGVSGRYAIQVPHVRAAIDAAMLKRSKGTQITAARVLQEIARLAFCDIRKFYNSDGSLKSITELDDDCAAALAGVEVLQGLERDDEGTFSSEVTKKIKLWDKNSALEKLAKHLKLLTDKLEVSAVAPSKMRDEEADLSWDRGMKELGLISGD